MGTRLKKIPANPVFKILCWLVITVMSCAIIMQTIWLFGIGREENLVGEGMYESYWESSSLQIEIFNTVYILNEQWERMYGVADESGEQGPVEHILEADSEVGRFDREGITYYLNINGRYLTNARDISKEAFMKNRAYVLFSCSDGAWSAETPPEFAISSQNLQYSVGTNVAVTTADEGQIYLALDNARVERNIERWEHSRYILMYYIKTAGACLGIALIALILLSLGAGRSYKDNELHVFALDKLWSEIHLGAIVAISAIGVALFYDFIWHGAVVYGGYRSGFIAFLASAPFALMGLAICIILLSLVRKGKAGKLVKGSGTYFTVKLCIDAVMAIWRWCLVIYFGFRGLFDGRAFAKYPLTKALFYKQLAYISCSVLLILLSIFALLTYATPLILFFILLEITVTAWYVYSNNQTFKEINKGFNESFEEQMKAERTKSTLIANVSHDLKTPLTSIISYIDLLSKEELNDVTRDYVVILGEKSQRLKKIVADLFDLSKSTTGDMPMDMEVLDIKRLVEQTLADMRDAVEGSRLVVKTKLPDGSVKIEGDGKKLYRVFQNVIDNTLKYSLEGSRVYVELAENNGKAVATVKNTASYEMEFTADEILQRFVRGDSSRTEEGSGLGLSIAQSFTQAMGGDFKVEIDGDLFKVSIAFDTTDRAIENIQAD